MFMRNQEKNSAPGSDRMQDQLTSWLTGNKPVAETTDVILSLMAIAPLGYLDADCNRLLLHLLGFLNQAQLVQLNMERMVSHA
jgi:hypothetical protein